MQENKNSGMQNTIAELKKQKIIFAMWNAASTKHQPNQLWYPPLKKLFGEVILFDPHEEMRRHGPEGMKKNFLAIVKAQQPKFILFFGTYTEFDVHTIKEINTIAPQTKTIMFFGDDDVQFGPMSRYYAKFVDYVLVGQTQYMDKYKTDGLHNAFELSGVSLDTYKPIKRDKIYDATLIGTIIPNRVELVRFLLKNGVNIRLWGHGWQDYPEFKRIWGGPVDFEDFLRITSESKINLSLTLSRYGVPHIKGRVFEIAACKSFQLVGYFEEYLKYFKEGKDIVMFKDNNDLLEKIKYYLAHEQEREKIAHNMYETAVKKCDLFDIYAKIFSEIIAEEKKFVRQKLAINKKIAILSGADFTTSTNMVKEKINSADYVGFNIRGARISEYRDYFLAHALEKTGKDISCCEYYLDSLFFKNSTLFQVSESIGAIDAKDFAALLNINQIMVTKKFFLENFESLRALSENAHPEIINEKNTAFVSMPLVWINKFSKVKNTSMEKAFRTDIVHRLQYSINNRKLLSFILCVLAESISKRNALLPQRIVESIFKTVQKR